MHRVCLVLAIIAFLILPALAEESAPPAVVASWVGIQADDAKNPSTVVYHKSFRLEFEVEEAWLKFTCYTPDDFGGTHYRVFANNILGPSGSYWRDVQYMSLPKIVHKGDNEIDIEVTWVQTGTSGPILAKVYAKGKDKDGKEQSAVIRTDDTWDYTVGKYSIQAKANADRPVRKVEIVGAADQWQPAKNPSVLPKISTGSVVGVTDLVLKGGNAGSLYQFNVVRDYSDKFYFLNALGYSSIEDYIFGQTNYQEPGEWFWGYDKEIARSQERAGFDFTIYPWVWVPAEWYRKKENPPMARCLEHGKDGFGLSLWSPLLLKFNEQIYAELKREFGDSVKFVYPGIYGDFGEAHYMAGWNPWMSPKPEHQHAGFWAGDDLARADFRAKMLKKHGTLEALNSAWKTGLKSGDEITYPKLDGTDPRRYSLDFVNWYYDCMTEFTAKVCGIAMHSFPFVPIAPKLGCGDENPMWGQDNSAIPKALAKMGVGIRSTHGSSPNFAVRRLSSACKFYGNRFETETAGGTNRKDAAKKFFIDASCGCSELFEYPTAILEVADIFSACRRNLRGEHSITDVALFFPTSWHRANLRKGYPPKLVEAAEEFRDLADFDIVDEGMVLDGALEKYKALAMFDADFTEQPVYGRISKWIDAGGTLLMCSDQLPFTSVEANTLPVSDYADEAKSGGAIHTQQKGQIVIWNGEWSDRQDYYALIHDAAYPSAGGSGVDGAKDGVWTSLFKKHVLYLNNTDRPVRVTESISPDLARHLNLACKPEYLRYTIDVPAGSQAVHFLDRPFAELAFECEEMEGAKKLPSEVVYRGGFGEPGRAVSLKDKEIIKAGFKVNTEADYAFCCIGEVSAHGAALEIDGKKAADIKGPAGRHKFMYPLIAKAHLKPGTHTIAIRCEGGGLLADKVVMTTDTELAGFAYPFVNPDVDQSW